MPDPHGGTYPARHGHNGGYPSLPYALDPPTALRPQNPEMCNNAEAQKSPDESGPMLAEKRA